MRQTSDKTKVKEQRGFGHGADYKPWTYPQEFNSMGTTSYFPDWKHGRSISLLSQTEKKVYLLLRWDDRNLDIREQFPLNLEKTVAIAKELGYKHPRDKDKNLVHMTTDFLVSTDDMPYAVTVKANRKDFEVRRAKEKLEIEKRYWESLGIQLFKMTREDIDPVFVRNIESVVEFYDPKWISHDMHKLKHLIATKKILVDMTKPIDFEELLKLVKEEDIWKRI